MSIHSCEEDIFNQWQKVRKGFVRDGVVSENDYLESNPKIVFILKEVNDPKGGGWDLREFVAKGDRTQTWNNIARWVHGIRNRESIPNWSFYAKITNEFRKEYLKSICAINLKKSPGSYTSNHDTLVSIANEDKCYIQNQYSIYDPDLTICCGTGDLFKQIIGHESIKWNTTNRGIWW